VESKLVYVGAPSKNLQRQTTSKPARCWLLYAYRMPLPTFREGNLLCDL